MVLLTPTGQLASSGTFACTIAENTVVQSNGHLAVHQPTKILGLPIPVYFAILEGFAAIFVLLAAVLYQESKSDKGKWE